MKMLPVSFTETTTASGYSLPLWSGHYELPLMQGEMLKFNSLLKQVSVEQFAKMN